MQPRCPCSQPKYLERWLKPVAWLASLFLGFPKHSVVQWAVSGNALALETFPIVKEGAFPML